jgi:hypothetical protein
MNRFRRNEMDQHNASQQRLVDQETPAMDRPQTTGYMPSEALDEGRNGRNAPIGRETPVYRGSLCDELIEGREYYRPSA